MVCVGINNQISTTFNNVDPLETQKRHIKIYSTATISQTFCTFIEQSRLISSDERARSQYKLRRLAGPEVGTGPEYVA